MKDKIRVVVYGASGYTASELLRLLVQHPQAQVCAVVSHSHVRRSLGELHPHLVTGSAAGINSGNSAAAGIDTGDDSGINIAANSNTNPYSDADSNIAANSNTNPYSDAGANINKGLAAMKCIAAEQMPDCDCVFFATPSGVAMKAAGDLLASKTKVIDLSPDFRIKDVKLWHKWYGVEDGHHSATPLLKDAVYGLPEANRSSIKDANLIANPGCYATATQLALLPLVLSDGDSGGNKYSKQLADKELVVDAKSGVSGAGRRLAQDYLLGEAGEDFTCYAAQGHRHQPEMEQALKETSGVNIKLRFVPHLLPVVRGIFADLYLPLGTGTANNEERGNELRAIYKKFYAAEPFVKVLDKGQAPHIKQVRGSNYCHLAVFAAPDSTYIQVCAVLDNLVKGASGQAIQNMNLAFGLDESAGLGAVGLYP